MKNVNLFSLLIVISISSNLFLNKLTAQTISAGAYYSLFICSNDNNAPWGWGVNQNGQLGNGTTTNRHVPVRTSNISNIIAICGRQNHSIALSGDSTVWSWGDNLTYGDLGDGTSTQRNSPVHVLGQGGVGFLSFIISISGGDYHSLAVKENGTVWAWGRNSAGQLGDNTSTNRSTPVLVPGLSRIISVTGGGEFSLALDSTGNVFSSGNNSSGQLGIGSTTNQHTFSQIYSLTGITAIGAGTLHSIALKNDSTVWTFGSNGYGQLGDSTTNDSSTPIKVKSLSGIIAIAASGSHSMALKSDGTVWGWGDNQNGDIGDGTTIQRNYPVKIDSLSGITSIACGAFHGLALKNDGYVWAWGNNTDGQIGDNTQTERDSPVQVKYLCSSLSVPEETLDQEITVAPNPFNSFLNISFSKEQKNISIRIYNVLGEEVESLKFTGQNLSIGKGEMSSGIYLLQIEDNKNNISNKKIIVQ